MPYVSAFDSDTDFPVDPQTIDMFQDDEPQFRSGWSGVFRYGEVVHFLEYLDATHPTRSLPFDGSPGCNYSVRTREIVGPNATEPGLCRALLTDDTRTPSRSMMPLHHLAAGEADLPGNRAH